VSFAPIAIVGRAVILPGALSPESLWEAVAEGRDLLSSAPEGRWGVARDAILTDDPSASRDRAWSERGGYVHGFEDVWDATGFHVPAEELASLDPLVHWTLHAARTALRDAGIEPSRDDLGRCGAIMGNLGFPSSGMARFAESVWLGDALRRTAGVPASDPRNRFMAGLPALLLAKALGLGREAFALDAACASSLYAVKLACDRLQDGTADVMLAGAVNRADDLFIHVGFCALKALSKTGRSRPFHAEADGLVPAEGAGFLVLKRLPDALRAGDKIHGIVRGVGLSNDGRGRGMLAPSAEGQTRALRAAYAQAGFRPGDIGLLECHATGTPVGDGTELRSTAEAFEGAIDLPIGSLKSNMGHLITAAGVAGIVKVLEAMRHSVRPPSLHADTLNPVLGETPFRVVREAEPWSGVRRAGVSAFGFGGNNAHVVIDAPDVGGPAFAPPPRTAPLAPIALVAAGAVVAEAADLPAFRTALFGQAASTGRTDTAQLRVQGLRFPPNDLKETIGQQLILLQAAREAVEGAGPLPRERTGVFIGTGTDAEVARYGARWRMAEWVRKWSIDDDAWLEAARDGVVPTLTSAGVIGTMPNIPANRLSSQLDLGGPGFVLAAEEHSGLVALDLGLRALRANELDAVVVGAADLSCEPVHQAALDAMDQSTAPGDAAVVMVLRRLEDVGDEPVLAVFDGPVKLETAPEDDATTRLTQRFGTAHAAHGLVDVLAAALCLHHRAAPDGMPALAPASTPAQPPKRTVTTAALTDISRSVELRAHSTRPLAHGRVPEIEVYSGADAADVAARLAAGDVSGDTGNAASADGPARLVLVSASPEERELRRQRAQKHLLHGAPAGPGVHFRAQPVVGEVAAVFAGAGAAWQGMGQRELRALPELQEMLAKRQFTRVEHALGWSFGRASGEGLGEGQSQGETAPTVLDKLWGASALCQAHFALTHDILGLRPTATLGYSSGETNALLAFGAWSDMDGFIAEAEDSGLFTHDLGGDFATVKRAWNRQGGVYWELWTVLGDVDAVRAAVAEEAHCHLAIIHTDQDVVIAGDAAACARVRTRVGATSARLEYDLAVHVPELDAVSTRWRDLHHRSTQDVEGVRFYSNATHSAYAATADRAADALLGHANTTLDLRPTILQAWDDGVRIFIEHGPQGAVSKWIRAVLGDRADDAVVVALDRRFPWVENPQDGVLRPVFEAAAALIAAGVEVDLDALRTLLHQTPAPAHATAGPVLTFQAHAPPVAIPPRPAARAPIPEPAVREVAPVSNPNPDPARLDTMAPAPTLPPVMPGGTVSRNPRAKVPVAPPPEAAAPQSAEPATEYTAPPAATAHSVAPSVAHGVAHSVAAQPALGAPADPVANAHTATLRSFGQAHQQYLQHQAAAYQRYMQVHQRAQMQFLMQGNPGQVPVAQPSAQPSALRAPVPQPTVTPPPATTPAPPAAAVATPPASTPKAPPKATPTAPPAPAAVTPAAPAATTAAPHAGTPPKPRVTPTTPTGLTLTREQLKVHASGAISTIYGEQFQGQDGYAVQCRMPEPPLLLADRVIGLDAEPMSMGRGTIWTETDVDGEAWYAHDNRMPAGVMIESGQADLMLISYLGIDALCKGESAYRLLGCTLTYHGDLPESGDTLRYDIHVDGHAKHGDVRLFFFHYDCVDQNGDPRLSVREGQAGFFTPEELDNSAGILWTPEEQELVEDPTLDTPDFLTTHRSFTPEQIEAFSDGRPYDAFGEGFELIQTHTYTPRVAGGAMKFIHRIPTFDPVGGPWGRGYLRGEADVRPEDWTFEGHFRNDPCMPGTLMFEGCLQAMALYMAALGVTVRRDGWRFQPVQDEPFELRCRGQVLPTNRLIIYEVFVEEFVAGPIPTLYADLLCTFDGLKGFHARRVGLQLVPDWPLSRWDHLLSTTPDPRPSATQDGFTFDYNSLLACAWGRPSQAFGPMYAPYDGPTRVARLPGPPYHFMSRVTEIDGPINQFESGRVIEIAYDIPDDVWYFDENGCETMPFAVLLEAALQPCGWLASAVGSALRVENELSFRNLDGTGTLHRELQRDAGTLRTRVEITNISKSAGMIIEGFDVVCHLGDNPDPVYTLKTVFGFFPLAAFENQAGLPTSPEHRAFFERESDFLVDLTPSPERYCAENPRLARPMLRMLDRVTGYWPDAGAAGLGQARGDKVVDPDEWFFKAHFFQDPVQPGSLGIEALIQLLQFVMLERGMAEGIENPRFDPLMTGRAMSWKYRGQVVPTNKIISSTIELTEVGEDELGPFAVATGSIWVDGKRIYETTEMGIRIVSSPVAPRPTREDPTLELDPSGWVSDHQPTFTVPSVPMMSLVDLLATAAPGPTRGLRSVRVGKWVTVETPRTLRGECVETKDGRAKVRVVDAETGEEIAHATALLGAPLTPPEPLTRVQGEFAPDPYAQGALFHGPAFQALKGWILGEGGSSGTLDADPGSVPVGSLNPRLLDAATHIIPHESLHTWSDRIPVGVVAYPALITDLDIYGPTPVTGDVRVEARLDGFLGGPEHPTFKIQLIADGKVWVQLRLVERTFPKGPLGMAPPLDRRAFLRDRQFVEGLRLSRVEGEETRLSAIEVEATDWLPGTVQAVYGSTNFAEIAVKEHIAAEQQLHPGLLPSALPLTRFDIETKREDSDIVVRSAAPSVLDLTQVADFWRHWFNYPEDRDGGRWPVEDLYYGLIQRFLRRVVVQDRAALDAIKGRSTMFLANHQTGVESLVFSIVASALVETPTVTLAKAEHKATWLGDLIRHSFTYPGVSDPRVITYFDRQDKTSLPAIIGELALEMATSGRSVMVHVEGTRSHECRTPVEKMSGSFIDMALEVGAPIVPVRFFGGLPTERLDNKIEFPVGMGQQDIWFGKPLLPEDLRSMHYGERKKTVLDAINNLGPPKSEEEALPGDTVFAEDVETWCAETGATEEHAALLRMLHERPSPCSPIQRLVDAASSGTLQLDDSAEDAWLKVLAQWCFGDRGPSIESK
jgi:acyl transferase domain-containing protein/3-hydroxymyristoyl/3-hydroxydecanoyl-(acyl carrier protein) dehydratase/1-acyl-sn-glycerol-3-phosphate acyltransferase